MDQVRSVADKMAEFYHLSGFAYTRLDFDERIVTLYFKGTPPAEVLRAQESTVDGVRVVITAVPYSEDELDKAAQELVLANREAGGPAINTVGRTKDYSGLVAYVNADALTGDPDKLANKYSAWARVPVTVSEGQAVNFQYTRQNDSPPWQGAGQARFPGNSGAFCTLGFAVLKPDGYGRLLTAGHCKLDEYGNEVSTRVTDGAGSQISPDSGMTWAPNYDSLLIDPTASPATTGKVFGGPWNATSSNSRFQFNVAGSATPSVGDTVCVSGANGGERCSRTITEVNRDFNRRATVPVSASPWG